MTKKFEKPIFVTQPALPDKERLFEKINAIYETKFLTNNGVHLQGLEKKLQEFLGMPNVMAFCNGTVALELAVQSLELTGEVITTPFTFSASTHALKRNGLTPVFCDIEKEYFNIDPNQIEALITERTSAILAVHVFGNPCNVEAIQKIADKHHLKVIYDAAHAFGVEINGRSVANFGNISMFSFHATKLFNTLEGGGLAFSGAELAQKLNLLRNFGIKNEDEVVMVGTNGKMNELQAAWGQLVLELVRGEIEKRKTVVELYRQHLSGIDGVRFFTDKENVKHNYQFFPITIDPAIFGQTRNDIYDQLKELNIFTRKYFYPLCSQYPMYKNLPSALPGRMPVAEKIVQQVLCLPLYGALDKEVIVTIADLLRSSKKTTAATNKPENEEKISTVSSSYV